MIEWYTRDGGTVGFRVIAEQRSPAMTTNKPDVQGEAEAITDADILAIAGRVESCPVSPWWLKDDVAVGDVRAAVLRFARALLVAASQPAEQQPALTKYQPCGCVICTCEHETQCQGCGAKHCGTHPVGQIPGPVYQQPTPDVSALEEAPINISYIDGNGAARSSPADCRYGVSYVTVADTVYWPLSADDAQLLRSAECGRGDFTGPANECPDVARLVEALELIAESCDVGRHDGLSEEGPALCATESWLIAKYALAAYRKQGGEL